ncbi:AraC family transcriptional regulator [Flavobacterium sp.]|uniref:helix-turn-helix domain-containing protein n=1 Tax=Flavobacterium sp. TaxID=239 RepID=UPI0011F4946E|nr:AraC family transcriptional regulator [Flavobacterium sp.]RZJ73077.1 MAG: AraC family transcriptional regulator [Flavobacterium sp.]
MSLHDTSNQSAKESVSIIRYRTDNPIVKAKIVLKQNLFTFLIQGEKSVHFAGERLSVKPNQFVLLTAGNCLMTEKTAIAGADYHSLLMFFDGQLLRDFFVRHPFNIAKPDMTKAKACLLFEKDSFLENFVRSLESILEVKDAVHYELCKTKLEELLLYISGKYPEKLMEIRNTTNETSQELIVRKAVTSHIGDVTSVDELAFLCNMSLSTFKRRFAAIYGTSPSKWLLEKRMDKAAKLLRQEKLTASEIYVELGYENLSSFIQSFKQRYGMTPKQYQMSSLDV